MLGIRGADHEETAPGGSRLVVSRLTCSLAGEQQVVHIAPGTLTFAAYGKAEAVERFNCNYGLSEQYRDEIESDALAVVGVDDNGGARIVELARHRFYVGTLYLPQLSSSPATPHPVIVAYVRAAIAVSQGDATRAPLQDGSPCGPRRTVL